MPLPGPHPTLREQDGSAPWPAQAVSAPLPSPRGLWCCLILASLRPHLHCPSNRLPVVPGVPPFEAHLQGCTFTIQWLHVALSIEFPPPSRSWSPAAWSGLPFPGTTCPFLLPVAWDVLPALSFLSSPSCRPQPRLSLPSTLSSSLSVTMPCPLCPPSTLLLLCLSRHFSQTLGVCTRRVGGSAGRDHVLNHIPALQEVKLSGKVVIMCSSISK